MKVLDYNKCFICQSSEPDLDALVQQGWGVEENYRYHRSCFVKVSGQEPKKKYSHKEWLSLAGEEWLLDYKWVFVSCYGNKFWYFQDKRHCEDGPAIEWANGTREWYVKGRRHREDGPAIEWANGTREWYVEGRRHREDGPAVELANGSRGWYVKGRRHREDGPAVELANGSREWWIEGTKLEKS